MRSKRISPMKGKRRKLVDLPEGATAKKGKRIKKNKIAKVVKTVATLTEENTEKGTMLMAYTDEENIKRALDTDVKTEIPDVLLDFVHLIYDVQSNYRRFLHEGYRRLDKKESNALELSTLKLAILATKIDHGEAKDVITPYLAKHHKTLNKDKNMQTETQTQENGFNEALAKQVNDLFLTRQQVINRNRNTAIFVSIGTSLAVSAAEMAISGDVSKQKLAVAAGSAALAAGTTAIVINAMDEEKLTTTSGAVIGGGIGLSLGGVSSFADRFLNNEALEE